MKTTSSARSFSIVGRSPFSLAINHLSTRARMASSSLSVSFACLVCIISSHSEHHFFRVLAAFFAEREREAADLFFAALRAWRDNARFEAALCPSRFNAREVARERLADFFALFFFPFFRSRAACFCVSFEPFFGGCNFTPARRAFERPIAIACLVDRAPCFPSRTCSISSRTNSPACVLGAFPSFLSSSARSKVSFSGINLLLHRSVDSSIDLDRPHIEAGADFTCISYAYSRKRHSHDSFSRSLLAIDSQ